MKKLFCLITLLLVSSFMFGATVWLPRIHASQSGCGDWIKFEDVSYTINNGMVHFRYKGKHYYSTVFVIED